MCFVQIFEDLYGAEATKLANWQRLCRDVGVPAEASIHKCKRVGTEIFFSGLLVIQETYWLRGDFLILVLTLMGVQELRKVYVNIYDLVHHRLRKLPPPCRHFPNYTEFARYTRKRMYPKEAAKEEGFLKELLREIFIVS